MQTIKYSIAIRSDVPGTKKAEITSTKAYPVFQQTGQISIDDLARHMKDHGSKHSRGEIKGFIDDVVDCVVEHLEQGVSVRLGDLGTLSPSLKVTGSESASTVSADNIKAVAVKYRAGKVFKQIKDHATFECVPSREAQALAVAEARAQETMQPEDEDDGSLG
ncbi:MAG: hypothetical protein K5945_02300 [Bacteroidaceae bacterium]|nr:hypothetical protein [Bacteroidaceae bacterium]